MIPTRPFAAALALLLFAPVVAAQADVTGDDAGAGDVALPRADEAEAEAELSAPEPVPPEVPAPDAAAPEVVPSAGDVLDSEDAGETEEAPLLLPEDGKVRLFQTDIIEFLIRRGDRSPTERARKATEALHRAVQKKGALEVTVGQEGDVALVLLDQRPVLEIGPDDAAAAHEVSAQVLAAKVASHVREAVQAERSRSKALMTLLSLAFVVFLALASLFLAQQVGKLTDRVRTWILEHPERMPVLRFRSIDVIRPESLESGLSVGLSAGKALAQLGIGYGWLLLALSLFDSTRAYAARLTGFVFSPLYTLVGRLVGSLPLLVVAVIAGIGLVVLLRFVGLFFEGVQRGEARFEWLPADLAAPTSVLVRVGVVLIFLVIAAPLVGGSDDGALTRAGTVALVTLGLAVAPLVASMAVGVTFIYGRRLRVGDFAELGTRHGKVTAVTLLEVRLLDDAGKELRMPHLLGLVQPTRVLGPRALVSVDVTLAPEAAGREDVQALLLEGAKTIGSDAQVSLLSFDADGACYRVSASSSTSNAKGRLSAQLAQALLAADVPLGRARGR